MGGGESSDSTNANATLSIAAEPRGPPTDAEDVLHDLEEGEEGEEGDDEGVKVRKGKESKSEAVLEKVGKQDM